MRVSITFAVCETLDDAVGVPVGAEGFLREVGAGLEDGAELEAGAGLVSGATRPAEGGVEPADGAGEALVGSTAGDGAGTELVGSFSVDVVGACSTGDGRAIGGAGDSVLVAGGFATVDDGVAAAVLGCAVTEDGGGACV